MLVTGVSPAGAPKGNDENSSFSPDPLSVLAGRDDLGGDFLAEEEDMILVSNGNTPVRPGAGHESAEPFEVKSSKDGGGKDSLTNGAAARGGYHGVLSGSTMKHVFELKGPALRSSPRTKDDESVTAVVSPSSKGNIDGKEVSNGHLGSPLRADSSVHLASFEDPFRQQVRRPLMLMTCCTQLRRLVFPILWIHHCGEV